MGTVEGESKRERGHKRERWAGKVTEEMAGQVSNSASTQHRMVVAAERRTLGDGLRR